MVPVQIWALTCTGTSPDVATRVALGTSLAVILPTAISGCLSHSCRGAVLWRPGAILGLSGLAGAFAGGTLAAHLPGDLLRAIFGAVVLSGAARMLFAGSISPSGGLKQGTAALLAIGLFVGVISGLTGIGGGVILVPAMLMALGYSMHQAAGTSSVAIAFNALGGSLAYAINGLGAPGLPPYSVGYISLLQLVLLAGTSVLSAPLGARAAHRLPGRMLGHIFMVLMIYVGLRMMGMLDWIGPAVGR